ncbi:MAG TPA: trehalose-phosphatase [Ornithinibacter sp.]|nr:trehalose-phosphatase [Ornithinibacter sp.]
MAQDLRLALGAFAARPRVLVAVDFDGTLAPLVTDPLRASAVPGGLEALRDAATLGGVTTAVVSGRDLATLEVLTGIGPDDGITLIGSHGAQTNHAELATLVSTTGAAFLDEAAAALLETLRDELEAIRSLHPAIRLEYKPAAVALHTRDVDPSTAQAATKAAHEAARRHAGVHVIPGKEVVELSVSAADKGTTLSALALVSRSNATLYVGDDATDERAFAALDPLSGDVTIKVGDGETVALHRVADPEAVVELLKLFVDGRCRHR